MSLSTARFTRTTRDRASTTTISPPQTGQTGAAWGVGTGQGAQRLDGFTTEPDRAQTSPTTAPVASDAVSDAVDQSNRFEMLWSLLGTAMAELANARSNIQDSGSTVPAEQRTVNGDGTTVNSDGSTSDSAQDGSSEGVKVWVDFNNVGSSRVDLQACKLEYSIVSPK